MPFSIIYISNSRLEATVPKVKGHQKVTRRVNAQNQVQKMKPLKKHLSINQNQIFNSQPMKSEDDNDGPGTPRFKAIEFQQIKCF